MHPIFYPPSPHLSALSFPLPTPAPLPPLTPTFALILFSFYSSYSRPLSSSYLSYFSFLLPPPFPPSLPSIAYTSPPPQPYTPSPIPFLFFSLIRFPLTSFFLLRPVCSQSHCFIPPLPTPILAYFHTSSPFSLPPNFSYHAPHPIFRPTVVTVVLEIRNNKQ